MIDIKHKYPITGYCSCRRTNDINNSLPCDVCSKYTAHYSNSNFHINGNNDDNNDDKSTSNKSESIEYGFHLRGDAPVIISYVELNSLADVSGAQVVHCILNIFNKLIKFIYVFK